jgi:hypothetical protein
VGECRIVLLTELELRDSVLPVTEMLRHHGILPHYPYDHEQWTDDGGMVIHRYTQPPRPRQGVLAPVGQYRCQTEE